MTTTVRRMATVRIGILGAARIAPAAVIKPARNLSEAEVVAVAARDRSRADAFASKHGVPTVRDSYAALVADPAIDAIYNPLPNGLHAEWTIAALEAGKHVLCEKPFTANAKEAEDVAAVAARTGLVVMEAFHYRYHPLAARMREIVESGELGTIRRVDTALCFPLPKFSDIRYQYDLAGGATMDVGTYTVHLARLLGRGGAHRRLGRTQAAHPRRRSGDARRAGVSQRPHRAHHLLDVVALAHPDLRPGHRRPGRAARDQSHRTAHLAPHAGQERRYHPHRAVPAPATYEYQLEAFAAAVLRGEPTLTPPADSIANMRVIDAIYVAAGMKPRGT